MKNFLYFSSKSFNASSPFAVSKFSTKCTALSDSKFCIIFFIFIYWSKFFNERDMDVINSEYFTEDVTVVLPGDDIVGIEGLKNYYGNYLTGFSDAEFTFVDLFGQGDKLVKHWNFKGTHDGNFAGIPATGKKLNLYGTTLILMENGKIKQEQD